MVDAGTTTTSTRWSHNGAPQVLGRSQAGRHGGHAGTSHGMVVAMVVVVVVSVGHAVEQGGGSGLGGATRPWVASLRAAIPIRMATTKSAVVAIVSRLSHIPSSLRR
jgi:hypothetical protein